MKQKKNIPKPNDDIFITWSLNTVGTLSGYRCTSDCRSKGRKFHLYPVTYFRGDFVEIDNEINSTVFLILIPSAESFEKGCFQLQAKVCAAAQSTG